MQVLCAPSAERRHTDFQKAASWLAIPLLSNKRSTCFQ